jgi:hypothetical protein
MSLFSFISSFKPPLCVMTHQQVYPVSVSYLVCLYYSTLHISYPIVFYHVVVDDDFLATTHLFFVATPLQLSMTITATTAPASVLLSATITCRRVLPDCDVVF